MPSLIICDCLHSSTLYFDCLCHYIGKCVLEKDRTRISIACDIMFEHFVKYIQGNVSQCDRSILVQLTLNKV